MPLADRRGSGTSRPPTKSQLEVLLKGRVRTGAGFLVLLRHFIVFEDDGVAKAKKDGRLPPVSTPVQVAVEKHHRGDEG